MGERLASPELELWNISSILEKVIDSEKFTILMTFSNLKVVNEFPLLSYFSLFNFSSFILPKYTEYQDFSAKAGTQKQAVALQFILKSLTRAQRQALVIFRQLVRLIAEELEERKKGKDMRYDELFELALEENIISRESVLKEQLKVLENQNLVKQRYLDSRKVVYTLLEEPEALIEQVKRLQEP